MSLKLVINSSTLITVVDPDVLDKYHVVITSYGTVASEHNDSPKKKKVINALFKVKWWRIVLGTFRHLAISCNPILFH
jgi:SNF2-related domain